MKKIHFAPSSLKKLIPLHWPKIIHPKETITKLGKNMWPGQVGEELSICIPDALFITISIYNEQGAG